MIHVSIKNQPPYQISDSMLDDLERFYDENDQLVAVVYQGKKYEILVLPSTLNERMVIFVEGMPFEVELQREVDLLVEKMGYNKRKENNGKIIHAPMPGHVIRIDVATGQKMAKGDKLLTLEAMKMENTVHANDEGMIKEIFVVEGQTVTKGEKLVEFL
jgi:biotin carboxyl carrier protein